MGKILVFEFRRSRTPDGFARRRGAETVGRAASKDPRRGARFVWARSRAVISFARPPLVRLFCAWLIWLRFRPTWKATGCGPVLVFFFLQRRSWKQNTWPSVLSSGVSSLVPFPSSVGCKRVAARPGVSISTWLSPPQRTHLYNYRNYCCVPDTTCTRAHYTGWVFGNQMV